MSTTINLSDLIVAVIEDDTEYNIPLTGFLTRKFRRVYSFFDLDEAYRILVSQNAAKYINVYVIDVLLPLPQTFNLPPNTTDFTAGMEFHRYLEEKTENSIPAVFHTGALEDNEDLEDELNKYIMKNPNLLRCSVKLNDFEQVLATICSVLGDKDATEN